jgi:PAS domain S-box-containing protein
MKPDVASILVKPTNDYYSEVMKIWQNQANFCDQELISFQMLLHSNPILKLVLNTGPCISWIINVRTGKYLFVSDNVERQLGYSLQHIKREGINYIKELIHPNDSCALWKKTLKVWQSLLKLPCEKRKEFQYQCDYRLRRADGSYIRLLEQNKVLQTDIKGNILLLMCICSDITQWKKSNVVFTTIRSGDQQAYLVGNTIDDTLHARGLLSMREKEIVLLLAEGYSFHTVNMHRKNIIGKTASKNVGQVVKFAMTNRLI